MKKICVTSADKSCRQNIIFENTPKFTEYARFDSAFILLKNLFAQAGYDLQTSDINKPDECVAIIYKSSLQPYKNIDTPQSYLIRDESKIISPHEWEDNYLKNFKKVFTYADDSSPENNLINFKLPNTVLKKIKKGLAHKDKFCCAVYSNKGSRLENELYTERNNFIRWYEEKHPDLFDLYGYNWDLGEQRDYPFLPKFIKKRKFFKKIFNPPYPSYRGLVGDKYELLERYKFSLAYENVKDVPSYISEKIFDCLNSGTIPIYWGASNILDYVPKNCFIDRRDFSSLEELHDFMCKMTDEKYHEYQNNIEQYLLSDEVKKLSSEQYAQTIFDTIIKDLEG